MKNRLGPNKKIERKLLQENGYSFKANFQRLLNGLSEGIQRKTRLNILPIPIPQVGFSSRY